MTRHYVPLLVIGLGGTGHRVALKVKAELYRHYPDLVKAYGELPFCRFFVFDTDMREMDLSETTIVDGKPMQITMGSGEFLRPRPIDGREILRFLDHNPILKAWLDPRLPVRVIQNGAAGIRPIGRLAFFDRFGDISNAMDELDRELRSDDARAKMQAQNYQCLSPSPVVFICSSLCGGTGSGTFLDFSILARSKITSSSQLYGFFLLANAFRDNNSEASNRRNVYASLKELDYFSSERSESHVGGVPEEFRYSTTMAAIHPKHDQLFNLVYLIDRVNEQGVARERPDLIQMIASVIRISYVADIGTRSDSMGAASWFDNVSFRLARPVEDGKPICYGSAGHTIRFIDRGELSERLACHLLEDLVGGEIFAGDGANGLAERSVEEFLEEGAAGPDEVLDRLTRMEDDGGKESSLRFDIRAAHLPADPLKVASAADGLIQREKARLEDDYRQRIEAQREEMHAEFARRLMSRLAMLVNSRPARGALTAAEDFLRRLHGHVEQVAENASQSADELEQARERLARQVQAARDALKRAAGRKLLRRSRVMRARGELARLLNAHFNTALRALAWRNASQFFKGARSEIETRQGSIRTLRDKLEDVRRGVAMRLEKLGNAPRLRGQETLTPAELRELYLEIRRKEERDLENALDTCFEEQGRLGKWIGAEPGALQDNLLRAARRWLEPRTNELTLEMVLERHGVDLEVLAGDLVDKSRVHWEVKLDRVLDQEAKEDYRNKPYTLVAGHRDSKLVRMLHAERGTDHFQITDTGDPTRVELVSLKVGLPVHALAERQEYETVYWQEVERQARNVMNLLHLHKDWHPDKLPELVPAADGIRHFAIAAALGSNGHPPPEGAISRNGQLQYFMHGEDGRRIPLGGHRDRFRAFLSFCGSQEARRTVRAMIERADANAIRETLEDYRGTLLAAAETTDDDRVQRLIRAEAEELERYVAESLARV